VANPSDTSSLSEVSSGGDDAPCWSADARGALPALSIIAPTFSERDNIHELMSRLDRRLSGRTCSASKFNTVAVFDYLALLIDKAIGHVIPLRFVMFAGVGAIGLVVHLSVLASLNRGLGVEFAAANLTAALAAMTSNFFLNNLLTYRDMSLRGFWPILRGLVSFFAVCAIGTAANVGTAVVLFEQNYTWWLAGLAGTFMGAVWNYTATSIFTWRNIPAADQPAPAVPDLLQNSAEPAPASSAAAPLQTAMPQQL
jgi:putative flippase GtrA